MGPKVTPRNSQWHGEDDQGKAMWRTSGWPASSSTIATVALHEEVEMQVKVEVIKSKITISYG